MEENLLEFLRCPLTGQMLRLISELDNELVFESNRGGLREGVLVNSEGSLAYPIIEGIPVMIPGLVFINESNKRHPKKVEKASSGLRGKDSKIAKWSFCQEWDSFFSKEIARTWGWTAKERAEQFLLETLMSREACKGKMVLDAGCGNGELTHALSDYGMTVIGVDLSTSVFHAEKNRRARNVHYVQGDVRTPPFEKNIFDIVFSSGVLHHTPCTYKSFVQLSKLVKPEGKFYLWLYHRSERFLQRLFIRITDFMRLIVCRLPERFQKDAVKGYASLFELREKMKKDRRRYTYGELVYFAYDRLTPRWRHYHTPDEVSSWFYLNGFSPPTITHWDNPSGFGMVASKVAQRESPGVNFGVLAKKKPIST